MWAGGSRRDRWCWVRRCATCTSSSRPAAKIVATARRSCWASSSLCTIRSRCHRHHHRHRRQPPPPAPEPPKDTDGDGILDTEDKCPTDPEDKDGFEDEDGCPDNDNDKDGIADKDDKCPNEAEVVNGVDDKDGCPDEGLIQLIDDRVVLGEKLLFDTARARVTSRGRKVLQAVVDLWNQHPEWERMEVEGHADQRGSEKYNQWLSEERARRVLKVLTQLGIPGEKLTSRGYGKTRPRVEGNSPEALQTNRRVELVVIRKLPATEGSPK